MGAGVARICSIDAGPALAEVVRVDDLTKTPRELHPASPHKSVSSASIRIPSPTGDAVRDIFNRIETIDSPVSGLYPECYALASNLAALVDSEELGRVMVALLPAGKSIDGHTDTGDYPDYYDRFHAVLSGECWWNGEKMEAGSIYHVENSEYHEVKAGNADRISVIIDIRKD